MKLGNIWWLASYPKSGNTWVRMFLLAYLTGEKIDINTDKQFVISDIQPDLHPKAKDLYEYLGNYNESISKLENICIKTHNANVKVKDKRLIPLSKTNGGIYVIRDPRDVVISLSKHYSIEIDEAIDFMNDESCFISSKVNNMGHVLSSWSTHVDSWWNTNLKGFKYEDLLEHTEAAFKAIIKVLYLPRHSEERVKFAIKEASFNNLKKLEIENGFTERGGACNFFRMGEANQWKKYLTKKQTKLIEEHHGKTMKGCKYL